ncbi:hypothetical protein MLD38_020403 [Melastoma candidum]|uniref:Uncharacterized protein n=1 Tax=Melastoma candidum TaxID=119954 RepID=A0ACB9QC98_9MYRT|nr:hypothetical protein MLD38_020403 [Melastoma candidum]
MKLPCEELKKDDTIRDIFLRNPGEFPRCKLVSTYGLGRMNEEVREWMMGKQVRNDDSKRRFLAPRFVRGGDLFVWLRKFSEEDADKRDC